MSSCLLRIDFCTSSTWAWPSSKEVTRSVRSCTSISRVNESTCDGIGLGGMLMLFERRPIGKGSGGTLEALEKLKDISRRVGCCG